LDYLTTHTSLSPIRRGFAPSFVNYKKGCTRLAAASDKVYQLLAHGRWFSPGTPVSSTTKTGRHDITEILLKVTLKHQKSKIKSPSNRNPTKGVILMVIRSSMRVAILLTILTTSLFLSLSQTRTLITLNVVHIIMISIQIFLQSHRLLGTKLLSHGLLKNVSS
jgi:hypothetical protein